MRSGQRRNEYDFRHPIAVTDGIDRVVRDRLEAEQLLQERAVDLKAGARNRARAERQYGHAVECLMQTRTVAVERPEMREQPMRHTDGLRAPQMRIRRHQHVQMRACLLEQRGLDAPNLL